MNYNCISLWHGHKNENMLRNIITWGAVLRFHITMREASAAEVL